MKHSIIIMAAGILMAALPALAHHSDAALDMNSVLTFEGVVTEYSMQNPHTYFTVETINDAGERVEWTVQMASALTVARRGWTRDTLSVGDRVTVGNTYFSVETINAAGETVDGGFAYCIR